MNLVELLNLPRVYLFNIKYRAILALLSVFSCIPISCVCFGGDSPTGRRIKTTQRYDEIVVFLHKCSLCEAEAGPGPKNVFFLVDVMVIE